MKWSVYILYSHKDGNLYVGCARYLDERLRRHNQGFVVATRNRRPLSLIKFEEFEDKAAAFNRERFLKRLWASRFKKEVKQDYLRRLNQSDLPSD